ncbi:hypothetical protein ACHQM5_002857 [Ranunculus cassubicifolius]
MHHEEDEDDDLQQIENPKRETPIPVVVVGDSQSQSQDPPPVSIEEEDIPKIQNPISVDDDKDEVLKEKDDPPVQIAEEETPDCEKGEDFGDLQQKIEEIEEKEDEIHEDVKASVSIPTTEDLLNVTRRATKRKKVTRQSQGLDKKLKREIQDPILNLIEEETDLIEETEFEKDGLKEEDEKPQDDDKDPDFEPDSERESDDNDEEKHKEEEPQGMDLSPPLHVPPVDEGHMLDLVLDNQPTAPNVSRKAPVKKNKKKKSFNYKKREALEKKLEAVKKNLQPIPFVPVKTLDFSKHEEVLKRLGLWEFVNMEFDKDIRSDFIAQLIVHYTSTLRCSEVNGHRIKVSRADLARALKLPVKKEKNVSLEITDLDAFSDESISFIVEILNQWLLPSDEAWILPNEVMNAETLIKKGEPHKVDWPGLIWSMVEKEITKCEGTRTLYYASHIQCLIRSQREELFSEVPDEDVPMDEEDVSVDMKMRTLEDCQAQEMEKEQVELCLGQFNNENKDVMDYKEAHRKEDDMAYKDCKEEPSAPVEWFMEKKSDFSLRRCNLNEDQTFESRDTIKEEAEDEQGYDPQSSTFSMGGLAPIDHLQDIGATNITYSSSVRFSGHQSGDMFDSGLDIHLNTGGTSMFPDAFNRELSHDDIDHKMTRNDTSSMEFNHVIGDMHRLVRKAAELYEAKADASLNGRMNEAHQLNATLQQQNEDLIDHLRKTQYELQQKDRQVYNLESELNLMTRLLGGYKKALKENRRLFSEYRQLNPKPEEPLYKDVGPGGLVLSVMEIERQRLLREEEHRMECQQAREILEEMELACDEKFRSHETAVSVLEERLTGLVETVKGIKETYANRKMEKCAVAEV